MNCLVKQFAICLGVFAILLLSVMDLLSVVGGALLYIYIYIYIYIYVYVWSSKECVCCACDPSESLDAPSICFVYFCMSKVISSFRSLRAGSQVFFLLMLFLCVILHTKSLGRSL